jgi:hypothetical protein
MLFLMKKSIVWIRGFVISDENAKRKYFQWWIFVVQKNILFNQLLKIKFVFSFNTNTLFYFKENRIISLFRYSFKETSFLLPNFSFQIFSIKGRPPLFIDFQISMRVRPIRLKFLPQLEHLKWRDTCSRKKFSQGFLVLFGKSLIFHPAQEKPYYILSDWAEHFLQLPLVTCHR